MSDSTSPATTRLDLAPARWIWYPSTRCLPNTFILFRRELMLDAVPARATGWIFADSRYRLTVNGRRVQWGPAPCDPRWQEADPVDLSAFLRPGRNIIGAEVLYYGGGDGTWAIGSPGLIFRLDVEREGGASQQIVSDESWLCKLDRAHRPGMYKRWFLRALQEEFDARIHPHGWDTPDYKLDTTDWLPAAILPGRADGPSIAAGGPEMNLQCDANAGGGEMRRRDIPLMDETLVVVDQVSESGRVRWWRDPLDWFESRVPNSFEIDRTPVHAPVNANEWTLPATPSDRQGVFVTFELPEQVVGWPTFVIDAPAGTIVELMTQESHDPVNGPVWLDTQLYAWTRFICAEGVNHFEAFDFDSIKWIQLHVRGANRTVTIREIGVRRRMFPWPNRPAIGCAEPDLQRLFDAAINTLNNSSQETVVDGMGRERQQYSGDGGHQVQAIRYAFGETRLPRRFLRTFSQGMTLDGYFLDCWPAFDRLARLMQRQIGTTVWGPLLDHGVGFSFDCWQHYLETGDLDALAEPYPRLLRFADYLAALVRADGMLPVEDIGVTVVWIDHWAFRQQRHKRCAFNLYTAAMFSHALAPIARAFGDDPAAQRFEALSRSILAATTTTFWCSRRRMFVNNLPWESEEREMRLDDRSLATSILFDQCPDLDTAAAGEALDTCPGEMGVSYPCNAGWRFRALGKIGRIDRVLDEWRQRWANMPSVLRNNSIQETWQATPDDAHQWSHSALAPIFVLMTDVIGIQPVEPGFARYRVRPQLGNLAGLDVVAHTPVGPLRFVSKRTEAGHDIEITAPRRGAGVLHCANQEIPLRSGETTRAVVPLR